MKKKTTFLKSAFIMAALFIADVWKDFTITEATLL